MKDSLLHRRVIEIQLSVFNGFCFTSLMCQFKHHQLARCGEFSEINIEHLDRFVFFLNPGSTQSWEQEVSIF